MAQLSSNMFSCFFLLLTFIKTLSEGSGQMIFRRLFSLELSLLFENGNISNKYLVLCFHYFRELKNTLVCVGEENDNHIKFMFY